MRIAIFGVGGAGGYFGARLVAAGEDVVFIARGAHLAAIRQSGLCVTTPSGELLARPAMATDDPAEVGKVDAVILGVKAHQVPTVAQETRPLLGDDSFVVPLQNGVEAADMLCAELGVQHVVGGLCGTVSFVVAPGHIRSLGEINFIRFGELSNLPSRRTEALRDTFERAGVKAEIPASIQKAVWEKFLFVVSVGGVSALEQKPIGKVRERRESRRMLELSMQEIATLAEASGVPMDEGVVARTMSFVDTLPADGTASLQRDLADGRPSELEAWNGAVVRLAESAGQFVPVNAFIYDSLLPREQQSRSAIS
jgi:2-dehydropantoate 2-reductase